MRADRLVAIILLLQTRGQLTAGELAELLDTSERTVRRDLDALLTAGVPLYSQRGRGGGWALLGGHRLNLTGFTVEEAQALFLVAGTGSSAVAGVETALSSALRKVFAALPEPLRAGVEAARGSTVVDTTGWGGRGPVEETPLLGELRAALTRRRQVDITYTKPGQPPTHRLVHPYGLVVKSGIWYLLGGTSEGRRTFRVSRITALEVLEDVSEVPAGFDLESEWRTAERDFFDRMRVIEVRLSVVDGAVLSLSAAMRGWASLEELPQLEEGWRRFSIRVPHPRGAALHLAAFGGAVRVEHPAEVRDELARLGRELVAVNSRPAMRNRPGHR